MKHTMDLKSNTKRINACSDIETAKIYAEAAKIYDETQQH